MSVDTSHTGGQRKPDARRPLAVRPRGLKHEGSTGEPQVTWTPNTLQLHLFPAHFTDRSIVSLAEVSESNLKASLSENTC